MQFSLHAERRLRLRGISKKDVEWVLENSKTRYYDIMTKNLIAVAQIRLRGQIRGLSVVYIEVFGGVLVVTAHPISPSQIQNRVHKGRWIRI